MSPTPPSDRRATGRASVPAVPQPASSAPGADARPRARASVPVRSGNPSGRRQPAAAGADGVRAGSAWTSAARAGSSRADSARAGSARTGVGRSGAGGGPVGPGGRPTGATYSGRRRPRWGRIGVVVAMVLVLLAGLGGVGGWMYYDRLSAGLERADPFGDLGARPAKGVKGALNILILGTDSRDPENSTKAGEWRTDTMIVMHVPASHDKAYLISIPRDLYVGIPRSSVNKKLTDTKGKINSAFAWGGLPLAVKSLEQYTNLRMDHVVMLDFGGFKQVTDALGGIDMYVDQTITSIHPPHRKFQKGMNHLNGAEALDYVRQRYQFPDGDFSRMRHQQQFMKALMDKAVSSGTLANPKKLNAFLQSITKAMTVDNKFSLFDMATEFKGIRGDDLTFMVSPNLGSQDVRGESVVMPDAPTATALYKAVRSDQVAEWVTQRASPAPSTKASATPKAGR